MGERSIQPPIHTRPRQILRKKSLKVAQKCRRMLFKSCSNFKMLFKFAQISKSCSKFPQISKSFSLNIKSCSTPFFTKVTISMFLKKCKALHNIIYCASILSLSSGILHDMIIIKLYAQNFT